MKISYAPLATIGLTHGYYAAGCRDIDFVATAASAARLRAGRTLARMRDGTLHLLYEAQASGIPVSSLAGETLYFALHLRNPYFANISTPVLTAPGQIPLYANTLAPGALEAPRGVVLVAALHTHTPQAATRPVTLSLEDANGTGIDTRTLGSGEETAAYDLRHLPAGLYRLTEDYGGGPPQTRTWLRDAELADRGPWGVLALTLEASFYAAPAALSIAVAARSETLRYYVVVRNYPVNDFDHLNIVDGGGHGLSFTRSTLPDGPLKQALLCDGAASIAVFESTAPIPRHERGLKKLQLRRQTTVLIEHLPLPGPERAKADLIVHLSKQK